MRTVTIFLTDLRRSWIKILSWGGCLFLLAMYLVMLHDAFISQQAQFQSMLSAYPPELMAAFGGTTDLFIPSGFLNFTYFSYVAVILGFLAISLGGGLLAADEERGRLELIAASPISRLGIFFGRLLAAVVGMLVILLLSWLGFVLFVPGTQLDVTPGQMILPHIELLAFLLFFAGLALLLSQVLPSRGLANGLASTLLIASYVLKTVLALDDRIANLEKFSPLHYIKGGYAIDGIDPAWVLGLLGLGLLFIAMAAWRFDRRDLRVSGEGNWPSWMRLGKAKAGA